MLLPVGAASEGADSVAEAECVVLESLSRFILPFEFLPTLALIDHLPFELKNSSLAVMSVPC